MFEKNTWRFVCQSCFITAYQAEIRQSQLASCLGKLLGQTLILTVRVDSPFIQNSQARGKDPSPLHTLSLYLSPSFSASSLLSSFRGIGAGRANPSLQ